MNLAVAILAGGAGQRIGGGKPLKLLGGLRLIDRAEALGRQWSEMVAVSVRGQAQVGDTKLTCIFDEEGIEGPLAGLVAALRYAGRAGRNAVLTIPVDMPLLPADLAERLSAGLEGRRAALARSGGHLHPVCGLWSSEALNDVSAYLATERRSLKGFAEAVGYDAVDWPDEPFDPFLNINSAEDLLEAKRLLAQKVRGVTSALE